MPNKWFAAALGFFSPPLAFIYLAKFKWALFYFLMFLVCGITDSVLNAKTGYSGLRLILIITCCIHAYNASRKIDFERGRKWYSNWWGVLLIPFVFFLVVFSFRSFLYEPFHIPARSMLPTLNVGDFIVVSKWGYGRYESYGINVYEADMVSRKKPNRGEVFALYAPHVESVYVERIIGLPNDVVEFSDKQLRINGVKIETRKIGNSKLYNETLDGNTYSVQYIREPNSYRNFKIVVPDNSYFVMGDNRDNSSDSRVWGMVPAENILGKLVLIW